MREIKFRSWDKGNERMLYDVLVSGNMAFKHGIAMKDVMQYTGLKDKNGKEIYEGDIVSDHVGVGAVTYAEKNVSLYVQYSDCVKWFIDYLPSERKTIEVIGNIFENPELLKEE